MKNLAFFILMQLICSCNRHEKKSNNEQKSYFNKLDSAYFYDCVSRCGFQEGASGLYLEKSKDILINFCYYDRRCCKDGADVYTEMKKIKNPLCEEKFYLLEKELPKYKISYMNDTVKIKYKLLDSIPFVFYEIVDTKNRFHKTIGKAYLLYENYDIGNFGYRVLVTDTTESYGSFIVETIMDEYSYKSWNENLSFDKTLEIKNEKTGKLVLRKVAPPYRVILPSEVLKK
jgi:hypothetical protein